MMSVSMLKDLRLELRRSAMDLSKWKLMQSAKWSSEALNGLHKTSANTKIRTDKTLHYKHKQSTNHDNGEGHNGDNEKEEEEEEEEAEEEEEEEDEEEEEAGLIMMNLHKLRIENKLSTKDADLYLYAQSLFDCKEFDRCAYVLRSSNNPCMKFLHLYSKYLSWDMKSQENMENELLSSGSSEQHETGHDTVNGSLQGTFGSSAIRKYHKLTDDAGDEKKVYRKQEQCSTASGNSGIKISIPLILNELNEYLEKFYDKFIESQPLGFSLLHYLKGILMKLQDSNRIALQSFILSLKLYPFNWGCWQEMLDCITRADEVPVLLDHLGSILDPQHIMLQFFKVAVFQQFFGNNTGEYGLNEQFLEMLDHLLTIFPDFAFLKSQQAVICYELLDYVNSEKLFDEIIERDPYRLEELDTYSNILYVMQNFSKLANLAQMCTNVDRFRPETCCVVANYYSSKQDHEKAIMYFRRALTLNKNNTSAWTLMGHEFIELKNTHAAIESYRRAVEINPKDFKAWYGLGQTYEIMGMHLYSLFYFQKSCSLRPLDKRIWNALGGCYEKLNNREKFADAINCYSRSLQLSGVDLEARYNIYSAASYQLIYKIALLYDKLNNKNMCAYYMAKCCGDLGDGVGEATGNALTEEMDKARLWMAIAEFANKNYAAAYRYASNVTTGTAKEIENARYISAESLRKSKLE
mgnify:CR=1 FL=1